MRRAIVGAACRRRTSRAAMRMTAKPLCRPASESARLRRSRGLTFDMSGRRKGSAAGCEAVRSMEGLGVTLVEPAELESSTCPPRACRPGLNPSAT